MLSIDVSHEALHAKNGEVEKRYGHNETIHIQNQEESKSIADECTFSYHIV